MKRTLRPDELRLWAKVARHARPGRGRSAPSLEAAPEFPSSAPTPAPAALPAPVIRAQADLGLLKAFAERDPSRASARPVGLSPAAMDLDPRRRRRIVRERDPIEARLDLHGLTHDGARAALERFILRAHADQARAVLVITGKGTTGEGVLRRFAPEWLRSPRLRPLVAGVSEADRRHGGAGALYVALKRRG